jgi:nitrite reductase/ring-hydroxylating ferredoxin subunit
MIGSTSVHTLTVAPRTSSGSAYRRSSPAHKQAFDLRSGVRHDDPTVRIPVYPVRAVEETVQVQACPMPTNLDSAP